MGEKRSGHDYPAIAGVSRIGMNRIGARGGHGRCKSRDGDIGIAVPFFEGRYCILIVRRPAGFLENIDDAHRPI